MPWYDAWGSSQTYPHYSIWWAWTFDTPYKWNKQIPSFFGGTRNGGDGVLPSSAGFGATLNHGKSKHLGAIPVPTMYFLGTVSTKNTR
jgi:hypothetical protein